MEELFKNYTEDEKTSYLFKKSLNMNIEQFKREIDSLENKPKNINQIIVLSTLAKSMLDTQINNICLLKDSYNHYTQILKKYSELSIILDIKNSLELCCLYTYLLWNGYFSMNNKFSYNEKSLLSLAGVYSFDIMNGNGICINNSNLLRDFLNINGYESAILANNIDKSMKVDYRPLIKRNNINQNLLSKTKYILSLPIIKKTGDHAFNLICDNNGVYIYDSTNLLLLNVESVRKAKLSNGTGRFILKPHFSYSINLPNESRNLLQKFYNSKNFENPYSKQDFIFTFERIVKLLNENKALLDKYYNEIEESIYEVSNTVNKIKEKKIKI